MLTHPEVDVLYTMLTSSRLRKMSSFLTFHVCGPSNLLREGSEAGKVIKDRQTEGTKGFQQLAGEGDYRVDAGVVS